MDRFLRRVILKNDSVNVIHVCGLVLFTVTGLALRFCMLPYTSGDWTFYLKPWTDRLAAEGFSALGGDFYNYTPLYMYVLYLFTALGLPVWTSVKIFSIGFDVVLAVLAGLLACQLTGRKGLGIIGYGAVLLAPTVAANSALWGQCDSIYAACIFACFYQLLRGRTNSGTVLFGVAFALKLQTLFLLPVLLVVWLFDNRLKLWQLLYIPGVYVLSVIPAWLAGRPLTELLTVYIDQSSYYTGQLTMNFPNIYAILGGDRLAEYLGGAAIWFTLGVLTLVGLAAIRLLQTSGATPQRILTLALLLSLVIPFFLPYMHDRYGYVTDLLAILFALCFPKKFYVPVVMVSLSFICYMRYLANEKSIPFYLLGAAYLAIILLVAVHFYRQCQTPENFSGQDLKICEKLSEEAPKLPVMQSDAVTAQQQGPAAQDLEV